MSKQKFPPGWDEKRVQELIAHYENQTEEEEFADLAAISHFNLDRRNGVGGLDGANPQDAVGRDLPVHQEVGVFGVHVPDHPVAPLDQPVGVLVGDAQDPGQDHTGQLQELGRLQDGLGQDGSRVGTRLG